MQVYIDQESVEFYKSYAARRSISFAEAVREALKDKQKFLTHSPIIKKSIHPIIAAIKHAQTTLASITYHYPDKDDDRLLYG